MLFNPFDIVAKHKAIFKEDIKYVPQGDTPKQVNPSVSVDAPILGNGDLTCAYVHNTPYPQFWVGTNDFWEMQSQGWDMLPFAKTGTIWNQGKSGPRTLGRYVFTIPVLQNAECITEQDLASATTKSIYHKNDKTILSITSYIAACENLLIADFAAETALEIEWQMLFSEQDGYGSDYKAALVHTKPIEYQKQKNNIIYGSKAYEGDVNKPTKLGFAAGFIGHDGLKLQLNAGEKAVFVAAVRSMEKLARPEEYAEARVRLIDETDLMMQREMHLSWWKDFWQTSGISIEDEEAEQRYYLSQYVMGSLSRDLHFPPNLFGVNISDNPRWMGNYKINYNHQAPYLALYASDHLQQADPHDMPYIDLLDQARDFANNTSKHRGALLPIGIAPQGVTSETVTMRMRGCNAMGICNMAMRWYSSYDREYARRIYAYVFAVADYWCNDLIYENGVYNLYDECSHETLEEENYEAVNASCTLAYIKVTLKLALSLSQELNIKTAEATRWQHVLENIAPFPVLEADKISGIFRVYDCKTIKDFVPQEYLEGKKVYLSEEKGMQWAFRFNSSLLHIYPAGEIGMESSEEELKIARDTIQLRIDIEEHQPEWMQDENNRFNKTPYLTGRGAFGDPNMTSLFFPAAVRVGYDPERIWQELKKHIHRGRPNGYLDKNPHGPENCSTIPNVIQEMMLLSHQNTLYFFKNWPMQTMQNAAFEGLLTFGAFKVSAALENGKIADIFIHSRKGKTCRIANPWPGQKVHIHSLHQDLWLEGKFIEFDTHTGEDLIISAE